MNKTIEGYKEVILKIKEIAIEANNILNNYDNGNYSDEGVINGLRETINEITHLCNH